jgi:hypothetical protein
MAIIIGNQYKPQKYELASEGLHSGEIVSIKTVEQTSEKYGVQKKIQFLWLCLDQKDSKGKWVSLVQRHSPSLHEKSNLRKLLAQLGITNPETFDLEKLKNVKADIIVTHAISGDRVFANISTIIPGTIEWPTAQASNDEEVF